MKFSVVLHDALVFLELAKHIHLSHNRSLEMTP